MMLVQIDSSSVLSGMVYRTSLTLKLFISLCSNEGRQEVCPGNIVCFEFKYNTVNTADLGIFSLNTCVKYLQQGTLQISFMLKLARQAFAKYVTAKDTQFFRDNGYALFKNFISEQQCKKAIERIDEIIQEQIPHQKKPNVFSDDFDFKGALVESADKIRLFYEGKAIVGGKFLRPREQSVNKIGHNLHTLEPIFKDITFNQKTIQIIKELGYKNPVVPQSMAILKPPRVGGEVDVHQDSTYLISEPDTLLAFWIPLQKCTKTNSCLWGIGQKDPPLYKAIRNSKLEQLQKEPDWQKEKFEAYEMDAGDLVIFNGRFIHKSLENLSEKSRYAYTWHLFDRGVSKWDQGNWIPNRDFPAYY